MRMSAALLFFLFAAPPARAETGTTALPFLKMDTGARAAALGGAYSAAGDDALAVFYNPAGTALAARKEVLLGHNEWLQGIRNESAAYVHPVGTSMSVFGGINALLSGSMDRLDALGVKSGSFDSREAAVSLGLASGLGAGFYGGFAAKALYQSADGTSATAWAGDAGLLKLCGRLRFGLSASNFGGSMKLGSAAFSLPLVIRGGVSGAVTDHIRVSADAVKAGETGAAGAFGAEAELPSNPHEAFYLRAGYRTGRSADTGPGFSAGLGLRSGDLRVDYAFVPYGDLGNVHRVTIALSFGAEREVKRSYRVVERPGAAHAQPAQPAPQQEKKNKKPASKNGEPVYFMW